MRCDAGEHCEAVLRDDSLTFDFTALRADAEGNALLGPVEGSSGRSLASNQGSLTIVHTMSPLAPTSRKSFSDFASICGGLATRSCGEDYRDLSPLSVAFA